MAIKNVNDFINSAEYTASLKDEAVHKAWYYATKLVEEKFTSTNKQSTLCTCKPVPMSKCLQRQLYVDDNCPQHGAPLS